MLFDQRQEAIGGRDSLTIDGGFGTWLTATVIVWLATALATLLIPFILVKAGVESARARNN